MNDKKSINKNVYSLDIETSTVIDDTGEKVSFMYLCGVGNGDITKINNENYKEYFKYNAYRTYDDVDRFLNILNEYSANNKMYSIVLIHNAEYEYSFFKRNVSFFSSNILSTNQEKNKTLFSGSNSFKILQLDNIIFIDTYLVSNMSLEKVGKRIGIEKLKELKTYKEVYTSKSKLPESEILYNTNDVLIPLVYYADKIKETFNNDITDINKNLKNNVSKMFTQTNSNKLFCQNNSYINSAYQYIDKNNSIKNTTLYKRMVKNFGFDSIKDYELGNQKFLKEKEKTMRLKKIRFIDKQHNRILTNKKNLYFKHSTKYYTTIESIKYKKCVYRKNSKLIPIKQYKIRKELISKQALVKYFQDVFQGGFTYANPYFCYKDIENVFSFDATSMYPFVMLIKQFPHRVDDRQNFYKDKLSTIKNLSNHNFKNQFGLTYENFKNSTLKGLNKLLCMQIVQNYIKNLDSSNLTHFVATVILKNLHVNVLDKVNMICPISSAKCNYRLTGEKDWKKAVIHQKGILELNNGKIKDIGKDVELEIKIDSVNLLLLMLFYRFDMVDCTNLVVFKNNHRTDTYILKEIVHFAKIKKELKPLVSKLDNNGNLENSDFKKLSSTVYELVKAVEHEHDKAIQFSYINAIYMNSKQNLNGLFGINVQKLAPENYTIKYDNDKDYIYCEHETSKYNKNYDRNYIFGMYIPSFARLHLFMFMLFSIIVCNLNFVYCDTDSVKCTSDIKNLEKWKKATGETAVKLKSEKDIDTWLEDKYNRNSFNGFMLQNDKYRNILNINNKDNPILNLNEKMVDLGLLGLFENDGNYQHFSTMGAKNYIYQKYNENEIHCTIAGINKDSISKCFSEFINDNEITFKKFVEEVYRPNLVIDTNIAKKLYHENLKDYKFSATVTDENGVKDTVTGYSGLVLLDIDVEIHSIENAFSSAYQHYALCKSLQGNTVREFLQNMPIKQKLYRSEKDKKLYITTDDDDFKKMSILIDTIQDTF